MGDPLAPNRAMLFRLPPFATKISPRLFTAIPTGESIVGGAEPAGV